VLNRLHRLFLARGIITVVKKDLATGESRKATMSVLDGFEREEAEHLDAYLEQYE
jgi:hypothetical protein